MMILTVLLHFVLFYGDTDTWETFSKLKLDQVYDEFMGSMVDRPIFSDDLKALDGKEITIEGYVIPLQQSVQQNYFVLSRFPYQACFFCGNAGPETVAEVYTQEQFTYKDVRVRVTGTLQLNDSDPLHLFYLIRDAEVVKLD